MKYFNNLPACAWDTGSKNSLQKCSGKTLMSDWSWTWTQQFLILTELDIWWYFIINSKHNKQYVFLKIRTKLLCVVAGWRQEAADRWTTRLLQLFLLAPQKAENIQENRWYFKSKSLLHFLQCTDDLGCTKHCERPQKRMNITKLTRQMDKTLKCCKMEFQNKNNLPTSIFQYSALREWYRSRTADHEGNWKYGWILPSY